MPEICCCCCSVLFSSNVLRHLNHEFHIYLKFCAYFLWCLVLYPPQIEFARRCILFAHIMQFIPPFYSFDISDQLSRDQQCRNEVMDHWNYKNQDSFNVLHFLTSFRCVGFFLIKLVKLPYPAQSSSVELLLSHVMKVLSHDTKLLQHSTRPDRTGKMTEMK